MRLGMFFAMGAVFVAAITIPEAFDDLPGGLYGPVVFAFCYLFVRLMHIAMFMIVSRDDPVLRRQVLRFGPSVVGSTILLLVASQLTGVAQTLMWLAALIADYVGTLLSGVNWRLRSPGHFAERHGLIIIVALGESIVATGIGIAALPITWAIILASMLGLAVSGALWWAYFDVTALITERALAAAEGDPPDRAGAQRLLVPAPADADRHHHDVARAEEGARLRRGRRRPLADRPDLRRPPGGPVRRRGALPARARRFQGRAHRARQPRADRGRRAAAGADPAGRRAPSAVTLECSRRCSSHSSAGRPTATPRFATRSGTSPTTTDGRAHASESSTGARIQAAR